MSGAWIDDFTRVGPGRLVVITSLAVVAWVLDQVAGLFSGLVRVLFTPFAGAAEGEWWTRRGQLATGPQAVRVAFLGPGRSGAGCQAPNSRPNHSCSTIRVPSKPLADGNQSLALRWLLLRMPMGAATMVSLRPSAARWKLRKARGMW